MNQAHREHLATLAQTLGAERELLEFLLYRLTLARLVIAADETRFIPQAMREVESVVERIRFSEAQRTLGIARLASSLGSSGAAMSLRSLIDVAPEPYRTMFVEHRDHFLRLAREIEQVTLENRRLASLAMRDLTDTLGALVGAAPASTYDASGSMVGGLPGSRPERFDGVA